jgi:hypothetical protein
MTSSPEPGEDETPRAVKLAVVGISEPGPCGMRDHGRLLADELEREGVPCSRHWLERTDTTLRRALAQARGWTAALPEEIAAEGATAIVAHYSCFASAYRGVPVLEPALARALRRSELPVVAIMHELVFPFGRDGARGLLWAVTHRAALVEIVAASSGLVVTTEERRAWVQSRRWLPRRPVAFAPVFSNLPAPAAAPSGGGDAGEPSILGVFGYSYDGSAEVILGALRRLADRGARPQLRLIGSPGEDSRAGRAWAARAGELGVELSFTGVMEPQPLSDELARSDLLLFADPPGPTSRKGTLAGSLASGAPLIALDGPATWPELARAGAARIVPREAAALADAIEAALADPAGRAELGARGREFASVAMGRPRTAQAVRELLG